MNALPQSRHEKGLTGLARSIRLRSEIFLLGRKPYLELSNASQVSSGEYTTSVLGVVDCGATHSPPGTGTGGVCV